MAEPRSGFMANKAHGKFMEEAHKASGKPAGAEGGEQEEGAEKTTIHHHDDGSFHVEHADGSKSDSLPSHLHVAAHIAHHLSGGDAHHVTHHDGIGFASHGVREGGEHEGPEQHNTADDAKEALGRFFNEEAQEPEHQHGGEEEPSASMAGY